MTSAEKAVTGNVLFTPEEINYMLANLDQYDEAELAEIDKLVDEYSTQSTIEKCQADLVAFCQYMQSDYLVGKHHRKLGNLLMEVEQGVKDRLTVSIAPRHGKSQMVSIFFTAWYLGHHPDHKVMLVSHTTDLAVDFGRKVRNLIASDKYREIFPGTTLSKDSKSAGRWNTTEEGEFFCCIALDTPVETLRGELPASDVRLGDSVLTSEGYREVLGVMENSHDTTVTINKRLKCSTNHPIYVIGRGWVDASEVNLYDSLWVESFYDTLLARLRRLRHGRSVEHANVSPLAQHETTMQESKPSPVQKLRGAWDFCVQTVAGLQQLLTGYGSTAVSSAYGGSYRQQRRLFPTELPVGDPVRAESEQADKSQSNRAWEDANSVHVGRGGWHYGYSDNLAAEKWENAGGGGTESAQSAEKSREGGHTIHVGWVRTCAAWLHRRSWAGGVSGQRKSSSARYMARLGEAAQVLQGLLLGVRRVTSLHIETHAGREFVNFTVAGNNQYFANGVLTHNCGVGSALAGRGAHLLVIDDAHSEQDVLNGNFEVFAKAYEWYTYGARTRLMPGGRVAIVGTRWHMDDLIGRVIADMTKNEGSDQFHVVEFPALLTTEGGKEKALWPEFFDIEALNRTKASMPVFQWNAQYQQNPTAEEGALVKREWWQDWEKESPPSCEFIIMTLDAAAETHNRADFTGITTWGVFFNEETNLHNIILLNSVKDRFEFPELKKRAMQEYERFEPDSFIVEKKSAGTALYQELRRTGMPVSEYTPHRGSGDKTARLNSVTDIVASGMCWVPRTRWAEELVEEVASFPFGSNDDLVDCTVMALMRFRAGGFLRLPTDEADEPQYWKRRGKGYY